MLELLGLLGLLVPGLSATPALELQPLIQPINDLAASILTAEILLGITLSVVLPDIADKKMY